MIDRSGLDRPLRILMLSELYPPRISGEGQYVRNLVRTLVQRGHQVWVATLAQPGLPTAECDRGVKVWRLRGTLQRADWLFKDPTRKPASPGPDPEVVWGLRRLLRRERPDLVHAHNWLTRSFLPLKPASGIPLVVTLHSYGLVCAKRNLLYRAAPCTGPALAKCADCLAGELGTLKGLAMLGARLGAAGRQRAVRFRASAVVPRIERLYRQLLADRPAARSART